MRQIIARIARRIAPRTMENLVFLSRTRSKSTDVVDLLRSYKLELTELKTELDEMRRDQRRMAELYDLVFQRVRDDSTKGD